jgi:hypothetical protein
MGPFMQFLGISCKEWTRSMTLAVNSCLTALVGPWRRGPSPRSARSVVVIDGTGGGGRVANVYRHRVASGKSMSGRILRLGRVEFGPAAG